jgi:hypothetical protein
LDRKTIMSEASPDQIAGDARTQPEPGPVDPDRLTVGLVLARDVVARPESAPAAWPAIADFHTAVVRPLLTGTIPSGECKHLLGWARVLGGADVLDQLTSILAEASPPPGLATDVSADDLLYDLMRLAEQIAEAPPPPALPAAGGAQIIATGPGLPGVVLAVRYDQDETWRASLGDPERVAAEAAVQAALAGLPAHWAARPGQPPDECAYWPPGVPFTAEGAALPVALARLATITGLTAPVTLSAGRFDGENFLPFDEAKAGSIFAAAKRACREILVPVRGGWRRMPPSGPPPPEVPASRTLDGAASVIWGEDWASWKRAAHAEEMAQSGWHFIDWSQTPTTQPIADHRVSQVLQLEHYCLDKSGAGSLMVLGGTPQSGRSAIIRLLARSLSYRKRRPWLVQVIAGQTRELPDQHAALQVAAHAIASAASATEQNTRQLLVFEDLQPIGRGNAADVLRYVAEQLHIVVLGALEYRETSLVDWNTDNAFVATSVVGDQARRRFVEDLANADSNLDRRPALAALESGRLVDLRMLTRLMSGQNDMSVQRHDRFAVLPDHERAALALAAAVSLISGELPEDEFAEVSEEDRSLFGVGPGRGPSTVRLVSSDDSLALLELHSRHIAPPAAPEPRWRTTNKLITSLLEPELGRMLRAGDKAAVEWLLGARLFHQELCGMLLKGAEDNGSLEEWVGTGSPMSVLRIVPLVDLMTDKAAQLAMQQLVDRICRGPAEWPPDRLLALIRTYQQFEFLLSSSALDDFILWLIASVDKAIGDGAGRPRERLALLYALDRLNREDAATVIAERALDVLAGLTVCAEDYRLVTLVDQLQYRIVHRAPDVPLFPVDQENPVKALLDRKPDAADGVGVLLEAMNLRRGFTPQDRNNWEPLFAEYNAALDQSVRWATPIELAQALQGIAFPFPQFCTWVIAAWKDFSVRARELMWSNSGATDVAVLLRAVAKANAHAAFRLINDNRGLAAVIAKRSGDAKDTKGIGQLLSSIRWVEEIYQPGNVSFSFEIAEALGVDNVRELIRYDPRISVRYYVIKGVWDAQASYRHEILGEVLSIVVESMLKGRKHWGPEIAMRLALDPEMGVTALAELRDRLNPDVLLSGMTSALTAHGRALYHRLGRALYPERLPARFLSEWQVTPFVDGLMTSSPAAALEVCAEVARTLTDADLPEAGPMIVAETGGVERWSRRLQFGRRQEAFTQAIRDLTLLDRTAAGGVLDHLQAVPSQIVIADRPASALLARLRHAMLDGPTIAPAMLRAIHDVRPQLAVHLIDSMAQDSHSSFVFWGELKLLQDPVAQSLAARNLVRVGYTRGSTDSAWIASAFEGKVKVMKRFVGPRSVTAILRMLASWDAEWGSTAAQLVDLARIRRRISFGSLDDIAGAIDLTRTLSALDNEAAAQEILEELLRLDLTRIGQRLGVSRLCALVDAAIVLMPDAVPQLARVLAAAMHLLIGRDVVLDINDQWLQVGRASRLLRKVHTPVIQVREASVPPNVAYAPVVAWAATGLNQPGWGKDALGRAAAHLMARPPGPDVVDLACLLAATGQGWAPELRTERTNWAIATAPFWLLRTLYAREASDPYLANVLAANESAIYTRARRDIAIPDWDASQLRLMLSARAFTRSEPRIMQRYSRQTTRDQASPDQAS